MTQLVVPQLGESITEAVIAKWLKQVGDAVAADEPVLDLETDKITVQLPSPVAGVLTEQLFAVGATVRVGDRVGSVGQGDLTTAPAVVPAAPVVAVAAAAPVVAVAAAAPVVAVAPAAPVVAAAPAAPLRLTPSQRQNAREHGVIPASTAVDAVLVAARQPEPVPNNLHPLDEVVKMSPLRKRIAERLVEAQQQTASLTTFNEVDMTAILELRTRYKETFEKAHGVKLGFMSFFVKASVTAAKLFPGINAEVVGSHIVYKKHYDYGIAVSTPKGLVVPVLRDCDRLTFAQIELGIGELAERARTAKLGLADLTGGTYSITNGGIYGSMMSTPLLNYPQTAILGMHNITRRAIVISDEVKIRPMMYLALTYDHRVVDGREAVSFLVAVKDRLEAPDRLLLGV
jgi:2-oxoglutarate dehydrogenase E2 component (dihydrolipoamide succinyltransferase)